MSTAIYQDGTRSRGAACDRHSDRMPTEAETTAGQLALTLYPGQSVVAHVNDDPLHAVEITVNKIRGDGVVLSFIGPKHEVWRKSIYNKRLLAWIEKLKG